MLTQKESQFNDYNKFLLNTYKRYKINFVKGEGSYLWDESGKKYLDMLCGIAVTCFGHNHPKLLKAAEQQIYKLWHVSNLFESDLQASLAEQLIHATGLSSLFFCNSGTEANEAAIKFARKFGNGRSTIITTLGGFHGRTMGSLSASAQYKLWDEFHPLTPGFKYVPFDNTESILHSIDKHTVAIMIEPIQGENGIIVPSCGYLKKLRKICDDHNMLLIVDEVQTGIGRTGKLFAYQWENVLPDIVTSAKGISNGLPLGAVICSEKVAAVIKPGIHGSTFGGNPLSVAVANSVINLITDDVLKNNYKLGEDIKNKINSIDSSLIKDVRGKGLMIGIQFVDGIDASDVSKKLLRSGVVSVTAGGNVLRLLPPFILKTEEIQYFIETFADILNGFENITSNPVSKSSQNKRENAVEFVCHNKA